MWRIFVLGCTKPQIRIFPWMLLESVKSLTLEACTVLSTSTCSVACLRLTSWSQAMNPAALRALAECLHCTG